MTKLGLTRISTILLGFCVTLFLNYNGLLRDFNLLPGNKGDSRLYVFVLEHWLNVLKGQDAALRLGMFFPDKLALGYSDALFLLSWPYILFRELRFDYFTSYQLLFIFMTSFGFAASMLMLRRVLKLNAYFSVVGAVLLTSLSSLQRVQLLGFLFYPALICLLWVYLQRSNKTHMAAWVSLMSFSLMLGLLFFTSYYATWFFVFSLLLFSVVTFIISSVRGGIPIVLQSIRGFIKANGFQLTVALIVFVASLTPFLLTYAPLFRASSMRSFGPVLEFSPTIRDIINVSERNYLWSPVLKWAHFPFGNFEVQMGSPILVLALFIVFYLSRLLFPNCRRPAQDGRRDYFVLLLSTTAFVILALMVKFHDISIWYVIFKLVPGASALRALGRYLTVFDMIVVVSVAYRLDELYESFTSGVAGAPNYLRTGGVVIVSAALIFEQAYAGPYGWLKAEELSFLDTYHDPGMGCKAFFINNSPSSDLPAIFYQLDAMMISMKLGIPTVNGYSSTAPDRAFTMLPAGVEYKYRILKWLGANNVKEGVCELDYQSRTFQAVDLVADFRKYEQLNRDSYLAAFSALFLAAGRFLADKNELSNLYPQFLEDHRYLAGSFGYEVGPAYRWMQNRYWIGEKSCPKSLCLGIGIVGTYDEVKAIIEKYGSRATRIIFPSPQVWLQGNPIADDAEGELLLVFPAATFEH